MSDLNLDLVSLTGWTIECDRCRHTETFTPKRLGDAFLEIRASGQWVFIGEGDLLNLTKHFCVKCIKSGKI